MISKKMIMVILICFLISGCHRSFEDPEYRQIITAMGIDAAPEDQIQLSLRLPVLFPGVQGGKVSSGKNQDFIVRSTTAQAISQALENIQQEDERSLFISQCKTIIFGETISRKGLQGIVGNLERLPTLPPTVYIVVVKGTPEEILRLQFESIEPAGLQISNFLNKQNSPFHSTRLWDLYQKILDPLKDPVLPLLEQVSGKDTMRLVGLALFKDDRMVGELDMDQSILLAAAGNFLKTCTITLPLGANSNTTVQIIGSDTAIKTNYRGNRPQIKLTIKMDLAVQEQTVYQQSLDPPKIRQFTRRMEKILKQRFLTLLLKLQQLQSDPLQFGDRLRIQAQQRFQIKRWPQEYQHALFKVDLHLNIVKTGTLK